jgi:hypothetical protein
VFTIRLSSDVSTCSDVRTGRHWSLPDCRCRLGGRRLEPIALGLAKPMEIGEPKQDLQRAVDRARQELERTETPADVASTANHECDLVTKRFWSRVSKEQVHRLERKRPSNRVVSGLHRKLESLARRARQNIAEAVGAWKRSRGPITCYPRWPGCIAISHAGRVSSGSPTAQIRWVVEPHRWSLAPSTSVIAGDRLRHGS